MKNLPKYKLVRTDRKADSSLVISTYLDLENGNLHTYKNDKIYLGFAASVFETHALDIHEMYVKIQIAGVYLFEKDPLDSKTALLN